MNDSNLDVRFWYRRMLGDINASVALLFIVAWYVYQVFFPTSWLAAIVAGLSVIFYAFVAFVCGGAIQHIWAGYWSKKRKMIPLAGSLLVVSAIVISSSGQYAGNTEARLVFVLSLVALVATTMSFILWFALKPGHIDPRKLARN